MTVASSDFQEMMSDVSDIVIDFAYVKIGNKIGKGATSNVCGGRFKNKPVAIKISTPPEWTPEEIFEFVREARISAYLEHENIVRFYGICVRPPEISMCFELCEGGDLKSHLIKNTNKWTPRNRLRACLHGAEAVAFLHNAGFMHRDIKSENFFVDRNMKIKLGDFGEATYKNGKLHPQQLKKKDRGSLLQFARDSNYGNYAGDDVEIGFGEEKVELGICGTVTHMAPELISKSKFYNEKVSTISVKMERQ